MFAVKTELLGVGEKKTQKLELINQGDRIEKSCKWQTWKGTARNPINLN